MVMRIKSQNPMGWGEITVFFIPFPFCLAGGRGEPESYLTQSERDFQNSRLVLDCLKNQSLKNEKKAGHCFGGWSRDGGSIR